MKKKKSRVPKPYNLGTFSEARMRALLVSHLRKGHSYWLPKKQCLINARIGRAYDKKTGRSCFINECALCHEQFLEKDKKLQVDHIEPMISLEGFKGENLYLGYDWTEVIKRLFLDDPDHYQALCKVCHDAKTLEENKKRAKVKAGMPQISPCIDSSLDSVDYDECF